MIKIISNAIQIESNKKLFIYHLKEAELQIKMIICLKLLFVAHLALYLVFSSFKQHQLNDTYQMTFNET